VEEELGIGLEWPGNRSRAIEETADSRRELLLSEPELEAVEHSSPEEGSQAAGRSCPGTIGNRGADS